MRRYFGLLAGLAVRKFRLAYHPDAAEAGMLIYVPEGVPY